MSEEKKYETMKEFWPYYLGEHADAKNRTLHFIGSWVALGFLASGIWTLNAWLLLPALVSGYAFAWIGHFFIEKNRPATFTYPFKSFAGDWIMFAYILTGKLDKEIERLKAEGLWHPTAEGAQESSASGAPQGS